MSLSDLENTFLQLLGSTLRVSTPLIFAALGGFFSERSGVINIALEGLMLIGAFVSAGVTYSTHSPYLGFLAGGLAASLFVLVYGFFVISMRANQIVAGAAMNMLSFGLVPLVSKMIFDSTGSTPAIPMDERFHFEPTLMAFLAVIFSHFWLTKTRSGLWTDFAGEHPHALHSSGISVLRVRYGAVAMSGFLAGLGGATLAIFLSSSYSRNMTAGRGFMALAALVFGKWKPIPTAFACLLFGFVDAFQIRLQGVVLWGDQAAPVQLIQIFPYVMTVLVLAGFVGKSRPPKSLGLPFVES